VAKLPFPDAAPGPLRELLEELHNLHARAGWPSVRELARGQNFSHTAVHELFTKPTGDRKWPVLSRVVEKLASLAPRVDQEATLDKFDQLWDATTSRPEVQHQVCSTISYGSEEQYNALKQEFARELKSLVAANGPNFDTKKLSEYVPLSRTMVWEILNGQRIPQGAVLRRILLAADVSSGDVGQLMAKAAGLRDWKRHLDAEKPGLP
jgi:hypothetical protein